MDGSVSNNKSSIHIRSKDISMKVIYEAEEFQLATYQGEYRNLMMLLYDKIYIEDFGECKGIGRCGTCMVEIIETKNVLPGLERNEEAKKGAYIISVLTGELKIARGKVLELEQIQMNLENYN